MKTRPLTDEDKKLTAKEFAEKYAGCAVTFSGEVFTICAYDTRCANDPYDANAVVAGRGRRDLNDASDKYTFVISAATHGAFVSDRYSFVIDEAQELVDIYAGKRVRVAGEAITNSGHPSYAEKYEEFTIRIKSRRSVTEVLVEFCNDRKMGHGPDLNEWFVHVKDIKENIIGVLPSSEDL